MSDDKIWIACSPRTGPDKPLGADALEHCKDCDCEIWVAASTVEIILLKPTKAWPVCIPCFITEAKKELAPGEPVEIHTTSLQDEEVRRYTGITNTEALAALGFRTKRLDPKDSQ